MKAFRWGMGALGLAAAGAIVVGALGLGFAAQAQEGEDNSLHARYLEILAGKLGISVDELTTNMDSSRDEAIDEAVADGSITEEQGAHLKDLEFGDLRARGAGHRFMRAVKGVFEAAANVIGIDAADLKTEVQSGKSLATVADENGVTRDALIAGITSEIEANLQTAVDEGKITAEQQQNLLDGLAEHIDTAIDRTPGDGPLGDRPFGGKRLRGFLMEREEAAP